MKLLLLSPYGAPPVPTAQSFRAGKIAKFLTKFGHDILIISTNPKKQKIFDNWLKEDMERYKTVNVIFLKSPIIPFRRKVVTALNFFGIPDNYFFSIFFNFSKIKSIIEEENIELIITSNTPSNHILGSLLSKKLGIKWIADLADKWSDNPYLFTPTSFHNSFQKWLEESILKDSSVIAYAVESMGDNLRTKFPNKPTIYLPNGYDPEDFLIGNEILKTEKKLIFCYFGTIYSDFNLSFIRAFVNFMENHPEARELVKLKLLGHISPNKRKEIISLADKFADIEMNVIVPHNNFIAEVMVSDFLIFSLGAGTVAQQYASSRLPIYIGFRKPTIACCVPGSDSEKLCRKYGAWRTVQDGDEASIQKSIEEAWILYNTDRKLLGSRYWNDCLEEIQWNNLIGRLEKYLH